MNPHPFDRVMEFGDQVSEMKKHNWQPCEAYRGELDYCPDCMSFEGATTTECPGVKMSSETSDRVYKGEIDFRNGEWCNQPAIGMSHVYGKTREPYQKIDIEAEPARST